MCDKERFEGCNRQFGGRECVEKHGGMPDEGECAKARREKFMEFYNEASVNDKLMIGFRGVGRAMRSGFEANVGQKRILMMLAEQGELTQRELTERLGIRPGSASEILAKLENAGLIARTQNEEDRRKVDVSLTESGAALAAESAEKRSGLSEEMFSCLSDGEKETLLSLLEKLRADWAERYPAGRGRHHGPHGECGCHGHHGPHGECGHHRPFGPHWGRPEDGRPEEEE
ncbi:MAG: MarR family transcriptional regulator [Clostridia bacterium]|nr:MarR family transcriptional regulator [Clostridia bacterium]